MIIIKIDSEFMRKKRTIKKEYKKRQRKNVFKEKEPLTTFRKIEKAVAIGRKVYFWQEVNERGKKAKEVAEENNTTIAWVSACVKEVDNRIKKGEIKP